MSRRKGVPDGRWTRRPGSWTETVGVRETPRRWDRELEPWEREPSATLELVVLEDLPYTLGDLLAAAAVLARFATLRLVLSAPRVQRGDVEFEGERRAAERYVSLPGAAEPDERDALARAVRLAGRTPPPELCDALVDAARCARRRGHEAGALALGRAASACQPLSRARS